jgi:hypothetical protein
VTAQKFLCFRYRVRVNSLQGLIDMLRYDSACPADESESHKVIALADGTPQIIELRRFYPVGGEPLAGAPRWRSFNASIVEYFNEKRGSWIPWDEHVRQALR